LLTGLFGANWQIPVIGINARRTKAPQEAKVYDVVTRATEFVGIPGKAPKDLIFCLDKYYKPGYAIPNTGTIEAIKLLARTEGILLDPVYTGKVMAWLIDLIRQEYFGKSASLRIATAPWVSPSIFMGSKLTKMLLLPTFLKVSISGFPVLITSMRLIFLPIPDDGRPISCFILIPRICSALSL
jgi:D-cysteine desulfhydrase